MLYAKNIEIKASYDVVVCGGDFSGFAAACSAAREGLKVILVERNGALGGVGTNSLVNHILGQRSIENGKGDIKRKNIINAPGGVDRTLQNRAQICARFPFY